MARFKMRWVKRSESWLRGPRILYFSADDLVRWTHQLEELNGPSEDLTELRDLIKHFRSTLPN